MKSEYERWLNEVASVKSRHIAATMMSTNTEPNRISRAEALRLAGHLIMQLEALAGLSIFDENRKSYSMAQRVRNLETYVGSMPKPLMAKTPHHANTRFIDLS